MKWFGKIGFAKSIETVPGVWENSITERDYYGEVYRQSRRWERSNTRNDNLNISNQISIVADQFAQENLSNMRYLEFMGNLWEITDIEIVHPRMTLSIGGVYNGENSEE